MKIYNTLTRSKEEFIPLKAGEVKMYVCGPTVYNYIHIGNARSVIAFDTIRRYLEFRGYQVSFVSNFTDVDDKMIKAAALEETTVPAMADKFIQAFKEDTAQLNIKPATLNPRATDNIEDIVAFIADLVKKDFAYEAVGDIYFRTRRFPEYGQLSGQNIDELELGASEHIADEETNRKEDPIDFALWKSAKEDEISWSSPWGAGRPGWHIECSVMATKYLGETIDIHGGGQDLEFPHHENEIAQSEAKTGHPFAHYWMHNGFVTVGENGEKMSKSLGNFVTVHELIKKVHPQVIRFLMATTQYRRPIQYSETTLQDAQANYSKLKTAFQNLEYRMKDAENFEETDIRAELATFEERFIAEMDDDFNAQNGITIIYELAKAMNRYSKKEIVSKITLQAFSKLFTLLTAVFGLKFEADNVLLDEEVEALLRERQEARQEKNFGRSDEIRDLFKEQGIILEDTPQGTRWHRG